MVAKNIGGKVHASTRKAWERKLAGRLDAIDAMWTDIYADVVKAYEDGLPLKEIGRMLGVEQSTASLWRRVGMGETARPGRYRAGPTRGHSGPGASTPGEE